MSIPVKVASTGEAVTVLAAGALCWRLRKGVLEVLLIHRPRYDDWSWPKGKLDPGETLPEAAVREVREEAALEITLGVPLADVYYRVGAGLKEVRYWAARADGTAPVPDGREVDEVRWCTPAEAAALLSNPSDLEPLQMLGTHADAGELDTWPLIVVRHAKAKPRSAWTKAEGERTLTASGARQALALPALLLAWHPGRVVTSPWTRCVATIAPYVQATSAKVKTVESLTEAAHLRKPTKTAAAVAALFTKARPVVLCTHRPVLPTILAALRSHLPAKHAVLLPQADPYLSPGEILVCQVSADSRIVSVERYKPYED
jgi:8-oxo-dGTP diphosphatase